MFFYSRSYGDVNNIIGKKTSVNDGISVNCELPYENSQKLVQMIAAGQKVYEVSKQCQHF